MATVYITDSLFPDNHREIETLHAHGHSCALLGTRDPTEIARRAADADALLVQFAPIGEEVLGALPHLKVMVRYGIGVDNFDLAAAKKHSVIACNCPGYCLDEVADHCLMLILAAARKIVPIAENTRAGRFTVPEGAARILVLSGKTLGIIGFGAIGRQVARRALAFGLRVVAHDPFLQAADAARLGVSAVPLDELLRAADIITLHCALTDETRHILGREAFERVKPGVIVINTGRGPLIDEAALLDALQTGQVAMAGLDVLEKEPPDPDHPLLGLPNVVVTPHIASVSEESGDRLQGMATDEVVRVLAGEPPSHPVGGTERTL